MPMATRSAASAPHTSSSDRRRSPVWDRAGATSASCSAPPRRSTPAKLATLYPSHAAFVKAWNAATDKAVKAGFVLPADAKNIKAAAAESTVGGS